MRGDGRSASPGRLLSTRPAALSRSPSLISSSQRGSTCQGCGGQSYQAAAASAGRPRPRRRHSRRPALPWSPGSARTSPPQDPHRYPWPGLWTAATWLARYPGPPCIGTMHDDVGAVVQPGRRQAGLEADGAVEQAGVEALGRRHLRNEQVDERTVKRSVGGGARGLGAADRVDGGTTLATGDAIDHVGGQGQDQSCRRGSASSAPALRRPGRLSRSPPRCPGGSRSGRAAAAAPAPGPRSPAARCRAASGALVTAQDLRPGRAARPRGSADVPGHLRPIPG